MKKLPKYFTDNFCDYQGNDKSIRVVKCDVNRYQVYNIKLDAFDNMYCEFSGIVNEKELENLINND